MQKTVSRKRRKIGKRYRDIRKRSRLKRMHRRTYKRTRR